MPITSWRLRFALISKNNDSSTRPKNSMSMLSSTSPSSPLSAGDRSIVFLSLPSTTWLLMFAYPPSSRYTFVGKPLSDRKNSSFSGRETKNSAPLNSSPSRAILNWLKPRLKLKISIPVSISRYAPLSPRPSSRDVSCILMGSSLERNSPSKPAIASFVRLIATLS